MLSVPRKPGLTMNASSVNPGTPLLMLVLPSLVVVVTVVVASGGCGGRRHCGSTAVTSAEKTSSVRSASFSQPSRTLAWLSAASEPSSPTTCTWLSTSDAVAIHSR